MIRFSARRHLSRLFLLALVLRGSVCGSAAAQSLLYVVNEGNNTVGEYRAQTGATGNAAFINGQGLNEPAFLARDGGNHLFVSCFTNTVGQYNATTGATINASFVNGQGLNSPDGMA